MKVDADRLKVFVQALRTATADERGVTAIEYGLLASLIVVACIGSFAALGGSLGTLYAAWSDAVIVAL